jgi:predicted nicotinamide N-methyase
VVLDLASGSGLVAIAAAVAGAASVTPSETDALAAAAITLNARVNRVRLEPTVGDLLSGPGHGPTDAARPDVVLAGDAFYDRDMAGLMLPFLERASQAGTLVLVGDPGRAYLPRERLAEVATYDVPVERVIEDADIKPATVWRLR